MANGDDSVARGALRSVFEGMSINFASTFVARAVGFGTILVLTNSLTGSAFGVYVFVTTLVSVIGTFAQLGTRQSLMKLIPVYDADKRNSIFGLAMATVIAGTVVAAIAVSVAAPALTSYAGGSDLLVQAVRLFAVVMVFETLRRTLTGSFLALERPRYGITIDRIAYPVLRFAAIVVVVLLGGSLLGVAKGILLAATLAMSATAILLVAKTNLRPAKKYLRDVAKDYYGFAGPIMIRQIGMTMYTRSDIILLGFLATNTSVAVYKIAWVLATIIDLPLNGAGKVFPPITSRFYDEGRDEELEQVFKTITKWTFTASLFLFAGAVVYRVELLQLFGTTYAKQGAIILILISFAQLVSNFVGPQGTILLMTGYERLNTVQIWIFGVAAVLLHVVLIPAFGLLGAAVAMFTTYVLLDVVQAVEVLYFRGYSPFSLRLLRPPVCIIPAAGAMTAIRHVADGVPAFLIGSFAGAMVYAAFVSAFVVDESDRELLSEFRS